MPVVLNLSKCQDPMLPCKSFANPHAIVFQALLAQKVHTNGKLLSSQNGWKWILTLLVMVLMITQKL